MTELDLQIERLRRHYEVSVKTYDSVSLLDLSHILRVFTELDERLMQDKKFGSALAFKSESPNRKLYKRFKRDEYIYSYLPGGTITHAHAGLISSGPDSLTDKMTVCVKIKSNSDASMEFASFHYLDTNASPDEMKLFEHPNNSRCNYKNWLGSEVLRYRLHLIDETVENKMARKTVIQRVANSMGASHPLNTSPEEQFNKNDKHLVYLSCFRVGGLPLPYFILLDTAQKILEKQITADHGARHEWH